MEISALDLFEELRFILELMAAEHLFARNFAKKKDRYGIWVTVGVVVLTVVSEVYAMFYRTGFSHLSGLWVNVASVGWYILLTLCTVVFVYQCYELTMADAVFLCSGAYSLQHMEYVMVNEVVARGMLPELMDHLPAYIALCVVTTFLLYYGGYRIYRGILQRSGGKVYEDTGNNIAFTAMVFMIVFIASFMCQALFVGNSYEYDDVNYLGAAIDFLICVLLLWVEYGILQNKNINQEKAIIEQLLYERKRQYELSRENIETINHKCHDLKHQIRALEQIDEKERRAYLRELEDAIGIYDAVVETGNEVVNTIISEKALVCGRRHIRLSCMVDASHLDFMSTLDIYALLGNALDNAIENVSRYDDDDKRVISLTIKAVGDFLSIQLENYCEGDVVFADGLPVTTKRNRQYHGFGMKSMRHLATKYGGSMVTSVKDRVFILQILLPMPPEFLRLYAQQREQDARADAVAAKE